MTSIYNKDLKNNDELKNKLVMLVRSDDLSVAGAARALGISERTAQSFYNAETQWAFNWWQENGEVVDKYYDGFGNSLATDCPTPEHRIGVWPPYKSEEEDENLMDHVAHGRGASFRTDYKPVVREESEVYKVDKQGDNSRILILSDIHFPYQHKDLFKFLQHLKDKYNPTRVICMGDETDCHALSFHDSDPDLPSAGDELRRALPFVQELYKMFPEMDILDSNHGSLVYRKAKHHGVPKHYIKSYNDVLGVGEGWKWSYDLTIDLPNGTKCYFHHGKSPDVVKLSQVMGMSAVQGHYHSVFKVDYWANPNGLYFGMQTGCLVDRDAYAFAYENCNLKKPIIGTGLIINSQPVLEPLIMNEFGDWVGK